MPQLNVETRVLCVSADGLARLPESLRLATVAAERRPQAISDFDANKLLRATQFGDDEGRASVQNMTAPNITLLDQQKAAVAVVSGGGEGFKAFFTGDGRGHDATDHPAGESGVVLSIQAGVSPETNRVAARVRGDYLGEADAAGGRDHAAFDRIVTHGPDQSVIAHAQALDGGGYLVVLCRLASVGPDAAAGPAAD